MSSVRPATLPAGRAWPVRAYIILLLAALLVPALGLSGVLLVRLAASEHARSRNLALATADRTADALDRELSGFIAAARTLAISPSLAAGNLQAFDAEARAASTALGLAVTLIGPDRQEVLNTAITPGTPLPQAADPSLTRTAFGDRISHVSNLFIGAAGRMPLIGVSVPVLVGTTPKYALVLQIPPARLDAVLREQVPPAGWMIVVIDAHDIIVARRPDGRRFIGHLAIADVRQHAIGNSGAWVGTSLEGRTMLAAFGRLGIAPWRVVVGVPLEQIEEPLRSALTVLIAGGLAILLLSAILAWSIGRRVEGPLLRLTAQAAALGRGEIPQHRALGLREADRVVAVLAESGTMLQDRGAALATERARLAALVEAVPVGLVIAEAPSGRIVFGNPQVERIVGHPVLMSSHPAEYKEWTGYHPDGRQVEGTEYPLARALAGEARPSLKLRYQRGDGSLVWMQVVAAPILDEGGVITGAVAAILDVDELERAREERAHFAERLEQEVQERTGELEVALARLRAEALSRERAEEQLRQAQKMEAVGRLTGGIAHDFNNLLTVVIGSLDLLRRRVTEARQLRYVDNALDGAGRAATLTQRLLAFSRQQPLSPKPTDVNRLVRGMSEMLHRTLGEQVAVETVLAAGLWQTNIDPNQLESAVLNLAVNARDAMEETSGARRLTIETNNAYLDDAYADTHPEVVSGQYVLIAVTDCGPGMPPEIVERAFEPFFTTKPQGKGTGLGLSQVHGFVKQSGGHVAIYSETRSGPGQGVTIKLYLPRYRSQPEAEAPATVRTPQEGQPGGLVLLVEDEDAVRRFALEALHDLGYEVLEASDGPAALRLLDANPEIVLLLTDVVLPGMDGRHLADEARRRRPDLPVLFTTGYTRNAIVHNGQLDPGVSLITKPFTVATLADKLRAVFTRPGPAKAETNS